VVTKRKLRRRRLKQEALRGLYKNRLYFCSSAEPIKFWYSAEYIEKLKEVGDPELIETLKNGDWKPN